MRCMNCSNTATLVCKHVDCTQSPFICNIDCKNGMTLKQHNHNNTIDMISYQKLLVLTSDMVKWKRFKDHLIKSKKDVKEIQEELERIMERYEEDFYDIKHELKQETIDLVGKILGEECVTEINGKYIDKLLSKTTIYSIQDEMLQKYTKIEDEFTSFINDVKQKIMSFKTYSEKVLEANEKYQSGITLYNDQKYEQALQNFKLSSEVNNYDSNIHAHFKMSICYSKLNNPEQSQKHYLKCLQLDPFHQISLHNLSILYFRKKQFQKVIQLQTKALQQNPEEPSYYNMRGISYRHLRKYNQAISDLTQAIKLQPSKMFYKNRAIAYEKLGDIAKCEKDKKLAQYITE